MPVHINKIGEFQFLEMEGSPELRKQRLEIIERFGVDGSGVRKTGKRGRPFQIRTMNYEESFESAKAKFDLYKLLIGDDHQEWIRQSVSEGTFLVLDVVEQDRYAIFNSIGGIQDDPDHPVNHECCHVVVWTLLG